MIKIVAGILIIFSCSGYGFIKAADSYGRIKFLDNLRRMLMHLRGEIKYAKLPMMEAFLAIAAKEEGVLKSFCIDIANEIERMQLRNFGDIWVSMTEKNLRKSPLEKSDIEEFKVIGEKLGFQDYEMQLAIIDLELEYLEEKICRLKEVVFQKQRVYRVLGIFSGLMITILLV